MTQEDIREIFPEATDEQVAALLERQAALLGEAEKEVEELRGTVERFQREEAARQEEARRNEEKQALTKRMEAALHGRQFLHPRLKELIAEDFAAALADPANEGKSDEEVFASVTDGQDVFASQNPAPPAMAAVSRAPSARVAHLEAVRRAMGLDSAL